MNRRHFLESLLASVAITAIDPRRVYSFPAVIVPRNIASESIAAVSGYFHSPRGVAFIENSSGIYMLVYRNRLPVVTAKVMFP